MKHYFSCAETAKLVRAGLKKTFPAITFSVRSKTYSGGGSITIDWTDGPTELEVKQVVSFFEGATFDGMIDLKEYRDTVLNGERVHFGSDFIFCNRRYSLAFLTRQAQRVAEQWGVSLPPLWDSEFGACVDRNHGGSIHGQKTVGDLICEKANRTRAA